MSNIPVMSNNFNVICNIFLFSPYENCRILLSFSYKLLIVGGGAGGCSMASKFASRLGKGNVAVIEPSEVRNSINYNSSNKKH